MTNNLAPKYNHQIIEQKCYDKWINLGLFKANNNDNKPAFTIVLPPPNVTGLLHLGHAWDGTIQDLLIRYKRLQGFNTLFLPGMDHAGIATQVKVAQHLKNEQNITLQDISRSEFLQHAYKWKTHYAATIRAQWAKLGLALDYSREQFTLNDNVNAAVNTVFVQLYNEGLIYRGQKIVNWDPQLQTAISNIEVTYRETKGKLYYLKYFIVDSDEFLSVATTRPETMFADQCLVVNSNDKRYRHLLNKKVVNPVNQMVIPVIGDDYVDINFGSGIMKCTPGHDSNDYDIALRHNLAMPVCMNNNGTMNELAGKYVNQDRFLCRKNVINDLQTNKLVVKITDYEHQVGYSQRSNVIVEPYLSEQWFVKMGPLVKTIIAKQKTLTTKITFFPENFAYQLQQWLTNIQDWCISRQLWWGHQLPVWYHKTTKAIYVNTKPPTPLTEYEQVSDVLDTWFSSSLWPFVTLGWPSSTPDFKKYYPTTVLVTAYDILFFWVARMMFMGWKFTNQKPFCHVLIHGLIRDEQGRKMSKSLNNGIDPMAVIKEHGADALRYFLVSNCAPGQDLRFSHIKVAASWNLNNKLWNAARYVLMNLPSHFKLAIPNYSALALIDQWILAELNVLIAKVTTNMEKYEFVLVAKELANFVWNKYCSCYIELNKVNLQNHDRENSSFNTLYYVLLQIIIMLHPFIPFITETIYDQFKLGDSILNCHFPQSQKLPINKTATLFVDTLMAIITAMREIRQEFALPRKTIKLSIHINTSNEFFITNKAAFNSYILPLVNSEVVSISDNNLEVKNKVIKIITGAALEINSSNFTSENRELTKLQAQLKLIEAEITRSKDILGNKQFLAKAPVAKVKLEQDKLAKYEAQLRLIHNKIKTF